MSPAVSIVIPVYNTGALLAETVGYIRKQTYKDFELLLIDDGSNDETRELCDRLSESDSRIRVIHKKNGGICSSRNLGIQEARGEYIAFSDHDDKMLETCLEKAMTVARHYDADVVRFRRAHSFLEDGIIQRTEHMPTFEPEFFDEMNWEIYLKVIRACGYGVWAGIVKKKFLLSNEIRFDETVKYGYEDHLFTASCIVKAGRIYILNDELYVWLQRDSTSTSCKMSDAILANRLQALEKWRVIEKQLQDRFKISDADENARAVDYLCFGFSEIQKNTDDLKEQKKKLKDFKQMLGVKNGKISKTVGIKKRILWVACCFECVEIFKLKQYILRFKKRNSCG